MTVVRVSVKIIKKIIQDFSKPFLILVRNF
uniref:Uncharacterized protein n=1 Tax=Bacteriophage sp. TaxID=38018 RepID=A0A8D9PEV3_9VIRU|nr:MAG TPA: hypothetical protein [Bacteriophage sp.]